MGRKNKKFECLECIHCKTRVFETARDLKAFCGRKSIKPNKNWIEEVVALGRVRLLWCEKQSIQHSPHGFSPRNASPRHTAPLDKILEEEAMSVFISSQNKDTFIPSTGLCPLRS